MNVSVSLTTQVFSATVSAALIIGKITGDLKHPACEAIANFIQRINDLFDCLNSRRAYDSNPYKCAFSEKQLQIESFLRKSYSWLKEWHTVSSNLWDFPCFAGFKLTTNSILIRNLCAKKIHYILLHIT